MTAVEWFFRWINDNPEATHKEYSEAFEQAKKMEKQQIIDAWNGGDYAYFYSKETGRDFADGTEYYNETYGSGVLTEGSGAVSDKGGAVTSSQTEISDEKILISK